MKMMPDCFEAEQMFMSGMIFFALTAHIRKTKTFLPCNYFICCNWNQVFFVNLEIGVLHK